MTASPSKPTGQIRAKPGLVPATRAGLGNAYSQVSYIAPAGMAVIYTSHPRSCNAINTSPSTHIHALALSLARYSDARVPYVFTYTCHRL